MWYNGNFNYAYGTIVGAYVDDTIAASWGGELDDKLVGRGKKNRRKISQRYSKNFRKTNIIKNRFWMLY